MRALADVFSRFSSSISWITADALLGRTGPGWTIFHLGHIIGLVFIPEPYRFDD
jgi:hypothetical protein